MDKEANMISLETELLSFDRYFEANSRCILSAPFGEGKSYFLNEFIKSHVDEYDFITIYPTNYQICDNRDILEYIKRDILFGLIALDNKLVEGFDATKLGILKKAILESREGVAACIPDINASVVGMGFTFSPGKVLSTLSKIWESCQKQLEVDGNPYKEYLLSFDDEKGGIYELDAVTNLICSLVNVRQENGRKVVLVVEDLDRIDPGQMFRILNVLSAHMTYLNGYDDGAKNKFNFARIILLCDFKNIEKIYRHLYGEKTDFKGYISKFSAVHPFEYSIRDKITKHIGCLIDEYVMDSVVSNTLATEIVNNAKSLLDELPENIRNIKDRVRFAATQYRRDKISVKVKKEHLRAMANREQARTCFDELYITTAKPLLAFMSICKTFGLNSRKILEIIVNLPRQYNEIDHVRELCGLPMIPLIPTLQPYLDYNMTFRLSGVGASQGNELRLSSDGEILEVMKLPYGNNILDYIKMDDMLDKVLEFDEYLY